MITSAPGASASALSPPQPSTSEEVTLHQLMDEVWTLSISLWMRCGHSLCGRLSFSSSNNSFMDNAFSLSISAFQIRIHLHHLYPHHLSSLCLYLDTPTFHLLHYVLLFLTLWMVIFLLDYVFVLDDMDLF